MLRLVRLQDHVPPEQPASSSTGNLTENLKGSLRRPVVGQVQANIRQNDAHQRNQGQIQPFGHHLRANQKVGLVCGKAAQDCIMRAFAPGRVPVPP